MTRLRALLAASFVVLPAILALLLSLALGVGHAYAFGFAIFLSAVLLWVSEIIPLAATALLIPCLIVVFGLDNIETAFAPFANSVIFLFIGAFLLARAMQKHAWDKRMAYWILLSPLGRSSVSSLSLAFGGSAFVLSMWVTNTATCAMLCPIVLGVIDTLRSRIADEAALNRLRTFLLLLVAYSCSIGGIATPVGTPPNLIALGLLAEHGIQISFLEWFLIAFPLALLMFVLSFFYLRHLFSVREISIDGLQSLRSHFSAKLKDLGPLSVAELQVAACFFLAVFLWIIPGVLKITLPDSSLQVWVTAHFPAAVVGLACGSILFFLPTGNKQANITWSDAQKIDWGTVVLFGGGLSLGAMLQSTGLAGLLGEYSFGLVSGNLLLLTVVAAFLGVFVTEFVSNTASASVLIAILLGALGLDTTATLGAVLALCLGTSYAFMFPVATPPNAIVFGTGFIELRKMIRAGIGLNLIGFFLLVLFFYMFAVQKLVL